MKNFILITLIILSHLGFSQRTVDTIYVNVGDTNRVIIEYNEDGMKIQDSIFYKSGNLKDVNYYDDNYCYSSIHYEEFGSAPHCWHDPEYDELKRIELRDKARLFTYTIAIILIALTFTTWCFLDYKIIYYTLLVLSLSITILIALSHPPVDKNISDLIFSVFFILPPFIGLLSISNLFRKTGIPMALSIIMIIICGLFTLWVAFMYNMAGATGFVG